jgi:hypothetical protein
MLDLVHVAGIDKKPTAPTVNATASKSKPKASKPKTSKPTTKAKGKTKASKPDNAINTATSDYCK